MDPVRFRGEIRYWRPEQAAGLAVADIPADLVATLGGLKQQRIHGQINAAAFRLQHDVRGGRPTRPQCEQGDDDSCRGGRRPDRRVRDLHSGPRLTIASYIGVRMHVI
jgi:hypothetical protein